MGCGSSPGYACPIELDVVQSISEVNAAEWDALAGEDDPFLEHAFLAALEASSRLQAVQIARERGVFDGGER